MSHLAETDEEIEAAYDVHCKCCGAEDDWFVCTRRCNHDGDHIAAGENGLIYRKWHTLN